VRQLIFASLLAVSAVPLSAQDTIRYGEARGGSITSPEQIVRLYIAGARRGDTVVVEARDPTAHDDTEQWFHNALRIELVDRARSRQPEELTGRYVLSGAAPFSLGLDTDESLPVQYEVRVMKLTDGPDHIGERVVPGDTIRGETLDYGGDTDDFTFAVPSRATVQVYVWMAASNQEAVAPNWGIFQHTSGGQLEEFTECQDVCELPAAGTYILRIGAGTQRYMTMAQRRLIGEYSFRIRVRN
jgi:hypothetical protein